MTSEISGRRQLNFFPYDRTGVGGGPGDESVGDGDCNWAPPPMAAWWGSLTNPCRLILPTNTSCPRREYRLFAIKFVHAQGDCWLMLADSDPFLLGPGAPNRPISSDPVHRNRARCALCMCDWCTSLLAIVAARSDECTLGNLLRSFGVFAVG